MHVEVLDLKRNYGKFEAVKGISFAFDLGMIMGFIGPNGAGKTTTMRCLASLDEPTGGSCWIDGFNVAQDPDKTRAQVGWVPDQLPTHRDMSVNEYLDFFARAYALPRRLRLSRLAEVYSFTHLGEMLNKPICGLSKGMKQRVSLARALLHDPSVLILDEPAAGLDPHARIELREMLMELRDKGKAILISSHILSELEELIDRAVIVEKGKLVHTGCVKELSRASYDNGTQVFVVEALCDTEIILKKLAAVAENATVRVLGKGKVEVTVEAQREDLTRYLSDLVASGLPLIEFRLAQRGLEKLFLSLTEGDVR